MTARALTVWLSIFAALLLVHPAPAAADEAILLIEQVSGAASIQRDGKRLTLTTGDALQEQDLIVTDRTGRMTLRLGRHGFVEVGNNAEVGVERLPFAAYARDLKSIFSVSKGYLRVVWKHPQLSSSWPLYVYMAGHRISLISGEYFFQNLGSEQRACVAAGQIALQTNGGDGVETVKPPSCARLAANAPPVVSGRDPDDWIAVRGAFSLEASANGAQVQQASAAPAPASGPASVASAITTRATGPVAATAAPLPLPAAEPAASDFLAALPELKTSSAAVKPAPPLGPVAAAPVLPGPVSPKAVLVEALPSLAPAKPSSTTTAPIVIGQVQATPAPPLAPATTPVRPEQGGQWALNIASYPEAAVAEREAARLRASGYGNASSQPAVVNGKTWYRVQLTSYPNESVARSAALEIKTKLGLQNIWVLKP